VLEQGVVHGPEMRLALRRRGFRGLSGVAGVRVLRARKVAIDEPEPIAESLGNVFDLRVGDATERALEIAVLQQRDGCIGWPGGVVAGGDRFRQVIDIGVHDVGQLSLHPGS
jgi:hypothetical protein